MKTFLIRIAIAFLFISVTFSQVIKEEWCVANERATDDVIRAAADWVCQTDGELCSRIQLGQNCYLPNTLKDHASVVFNSYYQRFKHQGGSCDFKGAAKLTQSDPSHDACQFEYVPGPKKTAKRI